MPAPSRIGALIVASPRSRSKRARAGARVCQRTAPRHGDPPDVLDCRRAPAANIDEHHEEHDLPRDRAVRPRGTHRRSGRAPPTDVDHHAADDAYRVFGSEPRPTQTRLSACGHRHERSRRDAPVTAPTLARLPLSPAITSAADHEIGERMIDLRRGTLATHRPQRLVLEPGRQPLRWTAASVPPGASGVLVAVIVRSSPFAADSVSRELFRPRGDRLDPGDLALGGALMHRRMLGSPVAHDPRRDRGDGPSRVSLLPACRDAERTGHPVQRAVRSAPSIGEQPRGRRVPKHPATPRDPAAARPAGAHNRPPTTEDRHRGPAHR